MIQFSVSITTDTKETDGQILNAWELPQTTNNYLLQIRLPQREGHYYITEKMFAMSLMIVTSCCKVLLVLLKVTH